MTFRDHFGAPPGSRADVQEFSVGENWQTWYKPRNCGMVSMFCLGGGSGGGGGMTGATGTVRGGGGGGGSGAHGKLVIPAFFCPDILFVQVGLGGTAGAIAGNGGAATRSFISIMAGQTGASYCVLSSGNTAATGGTAGSTSGSAAAGAGEVASSQTNGIFAMLGLYSFLVGKVGAIGGVVGGGAGAANTIVTLHQFSGGAGGGTTPAANTEFAGGAQTGNLPFPTVAGGTGGGNPGHGSGGFMDAQPWTSYGGTGGGTGGAAATVGGNGGDGGVGSGGGGGGGGVTGGKGGAGGPGYVRIVSW